MTQSLEADLKASTSWNEAGATRTEEETTSGERAIDIV